MSEDNEFELDETAQITERRRKLSELRKRQKTAFPNLFRHDALAQNLLDQYANHMQEQLAESRPNVKVAGRIMTRRLMGKASFLHLQDMSGRIQVYLRGDEIGPQMYDAFKEMDLGDIVGVTGVVFRTKTGELSIHANSIELLTKALRPLPDKFHGLTDQEIRYRQRYLDLMVNPQSRQVFITRILIIDTIREFLKARGYLEVETPMMQVLAGGAAARPFVTKHNVLDMELYLRIAPELYLKRLVVGGFDRVFEINRNFRNEGVSTRHNPEFTMVEFYQAYADYRDLMDLTELLFRELSQKINHTFLLDYQGTNIDFSKSFTRMTLKESILHFNPTVIASDLEELESARKVADSLKATYKQTDGLGKVQVEIFEKTVEHQLMQPTFITEYPAEVSPLARRNDENLFVTDRFEFFVGGREIANGFSELNDPEDQAERFLEQAKAKDAGDQEAMYYDSDYITALEYGMPPTAGEGIGIDRLVMLLTDMPSIRDVLLFPQMRPILENNPSS